MTDLKIFCFNLQGVFFGLFCSDKHTDNIFNTNTNSHYGTILVIRETLEVKLVRYCYAIKVTKIDTLNMVWFIGYFTKWIETVNLLAFVNFK